MFHIVGRDSQLRNTLARHARHASSLAAQNVRQIAAPDELTPDSPTTTAACVIAFPDIDDRPEQWVREIRRRVPEAKMLLLLPEDDPRPVLALLRQGVFDLGFRQSFSLAHLRDSLAHAANGASRPPYRAACLDTSEFNPRPTQPWAIVFREPSTVPTDRRHGMALTLLPAALGLHADTLLFQEVLPPTLPAVLELPSLAFALLSAGADEEHTEFLTALRALEREGRRVIHLVREGIDIGKLPAELQPPRQRTIRFSSSIHLYMQLVFGFGGPIRL